jgi:hypothetical protein
MCGKSGAQLICKKLSRGTGFGINSYKKQLAQTLTNSTSKTV